VAPKVMSFYKKFIIRTKTYLAGRFKPTKKKIRKDKIMISLKYTFEAL
jgi:hypothetical protein